jgi:hypothetical protein
MRAPQPKVSRMPPGPNCFHRHKKKTYPRVRPSRMHMFGTSLPSARDTSEYNFMALLEDTSNPINFKLSLKFSSVMVPSFCCVDDAVWLIVTKERNNHITQSNAHWHQHTFFFFKVETNSTNY